MNQITEQMKGIIEQGGGKVVKVEQWGLRSGSSPGGRPFVPESPRPVGGRI